MMCRRVSKENFYFYKRSDTGKTSLILIHTHELRHHHMVIWIILSVFYAYNWDIIHVGTSVKFQKMTLHVDYWLAHLSRNTESHKFVHITRVLTHYQIIGHFWVPNSCISFYYFILSKYIRSMLKNKKGFNFFLFLGIFF